MHNYELAFALNHQSKDIFFVKVSGKYFIMFEKQLRVCVRDTHDLYI